MRQRPLDLTPIRRREKRLAAQHPPERLDLGIRPVREVGERAALDLAALAPVLAQEHGGRRRAVRHARDVHKPYRSCYGTPEAKTACLHAHMTPAKRTFPQSSQPLEPENAAQVRSKVGIRSKTRAGQHVVSGSLRGSRSTEAAVAGRFDGEDVAGAHL